jgi:hypothetical protein
MTVPKNKEAPFIKEKVYLRQINKNVAKEMIVKNHYTHKWSLCQVAYGVYYKSESDNKYFDGEGVGDTLIGCLIYGQPVGRSAAASLSELLSIDEVFELTRLFIHDGYGRNIESYSITQSFKLLNKEFPKIKAVLSYADGEQGHAGVIYQATGFLYQGNSSLALMPNYSLSLSGPPDYNWMHSRSVTSKWGSCNIEHLKNCIGKTFWLKKESTKHRYVIFIGNKKEKRTLQKSLKHPILPYPKSCNYVEEIREIPVEPKTNNFF